MLLSRFVIYNKCSFYPLLNAVGFGPKSAVLICIPLLPLTFWCCFFTNSRRRREFIQAGKIAKVPAIQGEVLFKLDDFQTDLVEKSIFESGQFYEKGTLDLLKRYIKPESVVVDAGANIGNHTLYFSKIVGARMVYAFEPVMSVFAKLERNVKLNQCANVVLHNTALGSHAGYVLCKNTVIGNSGAQQLTYSVSDGMNVVPLDELQLGQAIDFMKIDVEGFEIEVLLGAARIISKDHPAIFVEVWPKNQRQVTELLHSYGYKLEQSFGDDNFLFLHSPSTTSTG